MAKPMTAAALMILVDARMVGLDDPVEKHLPEFRGQRVVVDPFFSGNPAARVRAEQVSPEFILVTHGHGDHVGDTVAIARRSGAMVIAAATTNPARMILFMDCLPR